jgi:hypothetical protein
VSELGPSQLLDEWRTAEQRLSVRDPDATDFEDILRDAERLRQQCEHVQADETAMAAAAADRSIVGREALA